MSKFSENIKSLRKQRHITQVQLAEKIGVSRSTISMYEMGEREPDFETLEAIADVFNVDMAYLIGTETKKAPTVDGESITKEQIKIALFGDDAGDISDEDLDNAVQFARFAARERKQRGDNK